MALSAILGLLLGSFASAMTYRIPRDVSWVSVRSACPSCGHKLSPLDLIPFFSWAFLRGKCRYCKTKIGWRYPLIELTTVLTCMIACAVYGLTVPGLIVMVAAPFLISLISIDLEFMILPDQINFILGVLGLGFVAATAYPDDIVHDLSIAVATGLGYAVTIFVVGWGLGKVLKKDALGFGDVKFFLVAGIWLGLPLFPVFLMLSGLVGVGFGLFWKIALKKSIFPFGPALIVAFALCLLFSEGIRGVWPV